MRRPLNLRQVEAFKAVIEAGTVSRAADVLRVSQPAVSKLIAHFEEDSGLELFHRVRGRLAPTARGMRLYEEIDRIFAGMRQVERAVEVVRREEQGQIVIGVMPALSGSFIQRATAGFLRERPHVYVSIMARSSQFIAEWLVSRQIDVAIISSRVDNPYFVAEPLMRRPLVCILPLDHPLSERPVIRIEDLADVPQIGFAATSQTRQRIDAVFEEHGLRPRIVLEATISPTVCEFVAAGLGVSLVHPLLADGMKGRVAIRRFVPDIPFDFLLCRARETRNAGLVDAFVQETRAAAEAISAEILNGA